jgi:antitoxin component of MazEF toxin-antitoxin module
MKRTIDTKLRKVGNSFVVTIPMKIIEKFKLEEGDFLEIGLKIN